MVMTLGLVMLPIYIHFYEIVPLLRSHLHHGDSLLHLLTLHIFPSVLINANMLFHFYKVCLWSTNLLQRHLLAYWLTRCPVFFRLKAAFTNPGNSTGARKGHSPR
jgi:hypothetical protein